MNARIDSIVPISRPKSEAKDSRRDQLLMTVSTVRPALGIAFSLSDVLSVRTSDIDPRNGLGATVYSYLEGLF
ncbi:hypothetical protein D9M69_449540 [compost metagenome]